MLKRLQKDIIIANTPTNNLYKIMQAQSTITQAQSKKLGRFTPIPSTNIPSQRELLICDK